MPENKKYLCYSETAGWIIAVHIGNGVWKQSLESSDGGIFVSVKHDDVTEYRELEEM